MGRVDSPSGRDLGALIEIANWVPAHAVRKHVAPRRHAGLQRGLHRVSHLPIDLPAGLTRGLQIAIAVFVFAINTAVYAKVFRSGFVEVAE
jgi:hypothetical protein